MSANASQDRLQKTLANLHKLLRIFRELWLGIRTNSIPWGPCALAGLLSLLLIASRWDVFAFQRLGLSFLYPRSPVLFSLYVTFAVSIGFWSWATAQAFAYHRFARRLELALITSGLRNRLGKTPRIVSDVPLDESTRKLRITSANFPKMELDGARAALESGLQVYIDEIREEREKGCFDIVYSRIPMPASVPWAGTDGLGRLQFRIGLTRAQEIRGDLGETPHLLVAGQTGGGKSTFLRQLITGLYLNNRHMGFTLIDLKGGLEFQLFEGLPRTRVLPDIGTSIATLQNLQIVMAERMRCLREQGAKDLDALLRKAKANPSLRKTMKGGLGRHLVVIDEASEMFLTGNHASASDIQSARRILSQLARQGRAVGIHLVIATQRPDVRALDPQVKANLTGILCFQMANDASSMVVLGNGRATDLPLVPGRAIWKNGMEMREIQTSFLPAEQTEALLAPHRSPPSAGELRPRSSPRPSLAQPEETQLIDAPRGKKLAHPDQEELKADGQTSCRSFS